MAALASRFLFSRQLLVSQRLFHTSRPARSIPQGKEREEFIDQGAAQHLREAAEWAETTKTSLSGLNKRFDQLHEIYYGKDRDLVNYPPLKVEPHQPKVRLGFLPDSWFQAFYDKTGVLGPYILALGLPTFLISKEYWVIDPEGMVLIVMTPVLIAFVKKYGQRLKEFESNKANELNETMVATPIRNAREIGAQLLKQTENAIQSRQAIYEEVYPAKHEILDLQLEEEYRKRLATVARTVERRMTYHIELANAKKNFQHQHLAQWVLDSVTKSITPQQEKETIQQCIQDLKGLAAKF